MLSKTPVVFSEVQQLCRPIYQDDRGAFSELFRDQHQIEFVQDNLSISKKGVIRGMHFQVGPGQAKLVTCLAGEIYDVFVDIRPESPTFGCWGSVTLTSSGGEQVLIPVGFAHGFAALTDEAYVHYKVSSLYDPELERGFCFDDPDVGIAWPVETPILSERDQVAPRLAEVIAK